MVDKPIIVCAWCTTAQNSVVLIDKEQIKKLNDQGEVTHGICPSCKDAVITQFKEDTAELKRKQLEELAK